MSATNEPGLLDPFMIDGNEYQVPTEYQPDYPLAQAIFNSMAGTSRITGAYRGDGLPDRPDSFAFQLPYDIDSNNGMTADQVEVLRATPGPHYFADVKQRPYFYSLRAAQNFLYLPREDAFGKWGIGAAATFSLNGAPITTVVYKNSVVSGDAVPNDTVWISKAVIKHPDSGRWVAPFKIGTVIGAPSTLLVKYVPVFRCDVTGVLTRFQNRTFGREDKILSLIEVN